MCGISVSYPGKLFRSKQMLEVCSRGLSTNEMFVGEFHMVHQLLSTTRNDDCANIQPTLIDEDSFLLFNGLITNTQNLAAKYGIDKFFGDTELLVNCFQKSGNKIFHELEGSFVICIVNTKVKQVTVFRDFSGSRPLFYNVRNSKILIHSDPRSIFAKNPFETGIVSRSYQLFGFVPEQLFYSENETMLRCFKPGVITTFNKSDAGWSVKEDHSVLLAIQSCNEEELLAKVIDSFSIGTDLLPSTIFLSGGVDSSLMALFLKRFDVNTITVASRASNEICRARGWSSKLSLDNISHFHCEEEVKEIAAAKDDILPFKSKDGSNILAATLLAKKTNARIAFSGAGLDELCNGYNQLNKIYLVKKMLSSKLLRCISQISGYIFVTNSYFGNNSENVQNYLVSRLWSKKTHITDKDTEIFRLISSELIKETIRWKQSFPDMFEEDKLLLYDYIFYTRNQLMRESDVLGYAKNIEIRVPFCEPNFFLSMIRKRLRDKKVFKKILVKNGWKNAHKEGFFFE